METTTLAAKTREPHGSRRAEKLRKQGQIPAVVYGHKEPVQAVSVPLEAIEGAIRHHSRVFDLQLDGSSQTVIIRDLQWNHLGTEILHIDFLRVSRDERIEVEIPVTIRGTVPGGDEGGVLEHPLHTLRVECPALAQPESIRVDVSALKLGDVIHVKDLKLPEGVAALDDPEAVVVQVVRPMAEEEVAPAPTTAEPEVIARKKEEEGEE
ncbi:MAG TPA: 50S ribosomal protein L25 [Gemmataceae bacterium]